MFKESKSLGQSDFVNDFFLQKKGLHMQDDQVPKYYEASSTINPLNGDQKGVGEGVTH